MKEELLKAAFEAGRKFEYAEHFGKVPNPNPDFETWYEAKYSGNVPVSWQSELLRSFELFLHDAYGESIVSGAIDDFLKRNSR